MAQEWTSTIDLGYLVARYRDVAEVIVDDGVDQVARKADRAIPVATGKTKRSQVRGRTGLRGHVAYPTKKALALHENLTERHRRGRAKFLEQSLASSAETIRRQALSAFRQATGG